jgi:glycosyltransferase involved in cell wall biosynthesis
MHGGNCKISISRAIMPASAPQVLAPTPTTIGVVVIARDEARSLERLLPRLGSLPLIVDIVLADGGSQDGSQQVAQRHGARVVQAEGGRGAQARAGASAVRGNVVWFLHADCRPARGCDRAIARACRDPRVCGGNFRLCFAWASPWARAFEVVARLQRGRGVYYGDSGQWARRAVYDYIGGMKPWPLFEDFDFARRLEHYARVQGAQTVCLRPALVTSARRFEKHPLQTLWLWLRLQAAFDRGESPQVLAEMYHRERSIRR